jgi:LysM repeat protein
MLLKSSVLSLVVLSLASARLIAMTPENPEKEYQEVRKIALRDPKIRAAYEDADRRLEEKILQIDPALTDYVHRKTTEPGGFRGTKKSEAAKKAAATPKPAVSGTTYLVKQGDTLGGIASQYGVTVTALKTANHIVDEKKLAVGQELTIPSK